MSSVFAGLIILFGIVALSGIAFATRSSVRTNNQVTNVIRVKQKQFVCTECQTVGRKVRITNGYWIVKVILFCFGIIPGIAYASWQESTKKDVCPGCKKDSMIPADTPRGKKLLEEAEQESTTA